MSYEELALGPETRLIKRYDCYILCGWSHNTHYTVQGVNQSRSFLTSGVALWAWPGPEVVYQIACETTRDRLTTRR